MKPRSKNFLLALMAALLMGGMPGFALRVMAEVDASAIPPPPEGEPEAAAPAVAAPAVAAPAAAQPAAQPALVAPAQPTPVPTPVNLNSDQDAYQYELNKVKDQKKGVEDKSSNLDKDQYDIWNRVNGILQYPSVSIHGIGRMEAFSTQLFGTYGPGSLNFTNPGYRSGFAYLDLVPMGSVSKPVRWNGVLRFYSNLQTGGESDTMEMLRATIEFNPDFLSATLGDFNEAYTPLTLWNRDSLDLKYKPEMLDRRNENLKYFTFLNDEPTYPFRGARVGTEIFWPDSPILERFGASAFVHMVRSGYNDTSNGSNYFGPYQFTDFVYAGKANLRSRLWYLGGLSLQMGVDAYGTILDQVLYSDKPGTAYNPNDSGTWAHQYRVGSLDPNMKIGFGGDFYFGGAMDLAYATYQDDKMDAARSLSDYAVLGGPYLQIGDSKLSFNFLDVGPNYFAPLAQMRQDAITSIGANFTYNLSPGFVEPLMRSQTLFSTIYRPSGFLTFYDRTADNVFPYGMATPNRQGFGLDLDIQALDKRALKIAGAAYFVKQIGGNLVANLPQTGYVAVEDPSGTLIPMREFVYVNMGPSLNLGPLIGWDRDLEIGTNIRYERTASQLGVLTSLWALGGIRVELLPALEISAAYSHRDVSGQEAGYVGTYFARSPYLFDNADLGYYTVVDMSGTEQTYSLSLNFKIDLHSSLVLDYSMAETTSLSYVSSLPGKLYNQFMGLTYDIAF